MLWTCSGHCPRSYIYRDAVLIQLLKIKSLKFPKQFAAYVKTGTLEKGLK